MKTVKKLRVALIAPQPYVEARGTPMAVQRVVAVLADLGHEVHVITYPLGQAPPEHPLVHVHRCRSVPPIKAVKIGLSPAKVVLDISLSACAARVIRSGHFDCIHGVEEGAFIAAIASRLAGAPLVYDMDSVMSHEVAESTVGRFPLASWLAGVAERWAIRNAALVMTISESMAEYVRRIDPTKDVVVVPDIPVPFPPGGPDASRARTQMPGEFAKNRRLVYAGSLAGYQGLDLLVSAMARVTADVPQAKLVVVGGDEGGIKQLEKAALAAGVTHSLLFMGKRPPDQIPDFLDAADVLVSPRRGGINPPAKIYTYMQSGRPIVATDIPAHTTVLDSDSAVLVDPTPEGIAEGILWTLGHPEEAAGKALRAQGIVGEITPALQERRIREAYDLVSARLDTRRGGARVE